MSRWIKDGKIIDKDFAYLCGVLVCGFWVGYKPGKYAYRKISMTTTDNSYGRYVKRVLNRIAKMNYTLKEYTYNAKIRDRVCNNPRTVLQTRVPITKIDLFAKLRTLKENPRKLNELILNSNKGMQKRFLQAIMDAKASPRLGKERVTDLDIILSVNKVQFPIIDSVLSACDIVHGHSPKNNPKFIYVVDQENVGKILKVGIHSKRVKNKIKTLVGNLYRLD